MGANLITTGRYSFCYIFHPKSTLTDPKSNTNNLKGVQNSTFGSAVIALKSLQLKSQVFLHVILTIFKLGS